MSRNLFGFAFLGVCWFAASGCQSTLVPRVFDPGSAPVQRQSALAYDPYPARDLSPGVEDVRPAEFAYPASSTEQSRRFLRSVGAAP